MADSQQGREKAHQLDVRLPRGRRGTRPPPRVRVRSRARSGSVARGLWQSQFATSRLQRSTVKVSYSKNGARGGWAAHGRYLAREGAQREGERGKGFGAEIDEVDIPKELGRWQREGDPRVFKLIVSPEAGGSLDLRAHARAVMKAVEKDLGACLEWVAIDHHNTDNPHVHIVLRGVDTQGHELRIDREYVKSGFRMRSQEAATQVLGLRTERTLVSARERVVERQHFTEIDRVLLRRSDEGGVVRYDGPPPESRNGRELRLIELKRLSRLSEMGLAERIGERSWVLHPDLERVLREFQLANDVIKARAKHQGLVSDPTAPLVRTELKDGLVLTGRVSGTGLADEAADRRYALIEGTDGKVHYVERPPGDGPSLRPGRVVTLLAIEEERRGRLQLEIRDHGKLDDLRRREGTSTLLDRDALRSIAQRGDLVPATDAPTFPNSWRRAIADRLLGLQETGLVVDGARSDRRFELTATGREVLEDLMNTLERRLPSLQEMAERKKRAIAKLEATPDSRVRGRFVGYAQDGTGDRVAVVATNESLVAIEARRGTLREGQEVLARAEAVEKENQRRRLFVWRIEAERELDRGR